MTLKETHETPREANLPKVIDDQLRELIARGTLAPGLQLRQKDAAEWPARHRRFYRAVFDLSSEKVLVEEVLRLIRLTDRYRALAANALPSQQRKATQERNLLTALAQRDRKRLFAVFEKDRTRIEQGIHDVLTSRGL